MENLEIYNKYRQPDKNALKSFNNGSFKGTDINSMWRIKSLTEAFGVCGLGWYYDIVRTWTEKGEMTQEIMAHAEIRLYVKDPETKEWSKGISGIGGNKLETWVKPKDGKDGYWKDSDECYKMAVTDALGNACKNLGFGADVYWENDKTKYTQDEGQNEKPIDYCTPEQVARMRELKVIEKGVCARFKVDSIEKLSVSQAQWVIRTKETALAKQDESKEGSEK